MEYFDRYIPKEYLALKINHCKKRLRELPKITMHEHKVNGIIRTRVVVDKHRYNLTSDNGEEYLKIMAERDELQRLLDVYNAIWNYFYKTPPPKYDPPRITRVLKTGSDDKSILNKQFFDSLKNDANESYPKPMLYPFNGIQYRSAAEKEIAKFYTDMGIPFKYEPEVKLIGMNKPQYPDFVLYIPELDTCKFHEHYGLMNLKNYTRDIKIKCSTYTDAGLLLDQDVYFTYNTEDKPLDVRYIAAKLNAVIYGTIIGSDEWIENQSV